MASSQKCHIVMVPYPGRGHINPMFTLCNQLISSASKAHQPIDFTIILTEEWLGLIDTKDTPIYTRIETIPNVLPSEHIRGHDNEGFLFDVYTKMEAPVERVLDTLEFKPNVIIADTFVPWVVGVGERRGVPVASFFPLLACLFPAIHHFDLLVSNQHYPLDSLLGERGDERVDYIPGIGSTRLADLPLIFHSYKRRMLDLMREAMSYMPKAQFIILRTLDELEHRAIETMKTILPSAPIYPIGPAVILPKDPTQVQNQASTIDEPSYIKWLNSQDQGSVLYVSLGSHLLPSMAQMEELAYGVLDSGVPFLWVGREEAVFLKDICESNSNNSNKWHIVSWCDQMKVLYHKSVGGFLSHAGLNSVLESAFAGVPMLTFPLSSDQPMYSKLVVEDWEIGWRLRDKIEKDVLVNRENVSELVKKLMDFNCDERIKLDEKCKEFKKVVWDAIGEDSSAERNVGQFLRDISGGD
ncbi:hypothetical protein vseg_000559 [Gypsophila vaccaria]